MLGRANKSYHSREITEFDLYMEATFANIADLGSDIYNTF